MKNRAANELESKRRGRRRVRTAIAPVQTLDRALNVLEALVASQPVGLSDLSRQVGLHTSTVSRILETLRQRSFIEYDDYSGLFRLGVKTLEIGNAYLQGRPLADAADSVMRELSETLQETVNLVVRDGDMAVYIKQIQNESHTIRMFTREGARVPIYCTAIGKIILGDLDPEEIREVLGDTEFIPFTKNTVSDCDEFAKLAKRSAKRGYAWDDEERELGVRCIAAPIRDAEGQVVAALSVSAPVMRMTKAQGTAYSSPLIDAAERISRKLGYLG